MTINVCRGIYLLLLQVGLLLAPIGSFSGAIKASRVNTRSLSDTEKLNIEVY